MRYGIWLNARDMDTVDFGLIKGRITDIFLSETVTDDKLPGFLKKAHDNGIKVHMWVFCFNKEGKWVDPKNEAIRTDIKNRIKSHLQKGVDGIHLDYFRYPGTAYKYDGTEAITSFAKEVKSLIPAGKVLSAAVMPEGTVNTYYYGQDYAQLGKYLILCPMIYKGNYKQPTSWIKSTTANIKKLSGNATVWAGLQTYYSDSNVKLLTSGEMKVDVDNAIAGGADGVVFFRWGLLSLDYVKSITPSLIQSETVDKAFTGEYVDLPSFKDMLNRYNAFVAEKHTEPRIIYLKCCKGDYIPLATFKDMLNRYTRFKEENGVEPRIIYLKAPANATSTIQGNWVLTGFFSQDYQDTGYTCGPSSLQMALSALGCNVTESQLMKWAGTGYSGTGHAGMLNAIKTAASYCKKNITGGFYAFNSTGWSKVAEWVKAGKEIVLHVWTSPLRYDVNGSTVWQGGYGHYVYLVGVNQKDKLVKIADPMKGIRTFRMNDVEAAMANISQPSILLIQKIG